MLESCPDGKTEQASWSQVPRYSGERTSEHTGTERYYWLVADKWMC